VGVGSTIGVITLGGSTGNNTDNSADNKEG